MTAQSISDLVKDWGGFEHLVAQLHQTGDVSVEHNVTLKGQSGATRQIDVLIRHRQGLYDHLIVAECKYWKTHVRRLHVDALATTIREVGASSGVIFSRKGFQSGALTQAQHEKISLFKLREPTDLEWGLPGRHVDIWLHVIFASLGNLQMPGLMLPVGWPPGRPVNVNLNLGDADTVFSTAIKADGKSDATLEAVLIRMARLSMQTAHNPQPINLGGSFEGEVRRIVPVKFEPKVPTLIFVDGTIILAPSITFDLGLRVSQTRIQIDRASNFSFVLAVEDCVTQSVHLASRRADESQTEFTIFTPTNDTQTDAIRNGAVMSVFMGSLIDFSEFAGAIRSTGPEVKVTLPP